jgi:hypothetical protein
MRSNKKFNPNDLGAGEVITVVVEDDSCPICGVKLTAFSNDKNQVPSPGDLSICYNCTSVLEICEDYTVIELPSEEFEQLDIDVRHHIKEAQRRLRTLISMSSNHLQ